MTEKHNDYILGQDVTATAAGSQKQGSVVLSVRLAAAEVARLETVARAANKTVAQIVREALASYAASELREHNVTIGSGDLVFKVGNTDQLSEGRNVGPNMLFAQTGSG